MKSLKIITLFVLFTLISCSKDSDESTTVTITTSDFSKVIDENPADGQVIGTISGSTNQGTVSFSLIEESPTGALYIDAATGELKVANASLFDFETNPTITGTVKVTSGTVSKNALITITLSDLNDKNIYEGSIQLKTQQEVDDFGANNYYKITGSLTIGYLEGEILSDILDLSPLNSLKIVGTSLLISQNANLVSTEGLNIEEIGSQLSFVQNPALEKLVGFKSVANLSFGIFLFHNEKLTDVSDLNGITQLGRLIIIRNPIENLDWLANLTSITSGEILIDNCSLLKNIDGLSNVTALSGEYKNVTISNNIALENLNGLQNLTASVLELKIDNNSSILSLHGIENIIPYQELNIARNTSLQNLNGLENITDPLSNITIERNNSLTNLDGLNNLTHISVCYIAYNENLVSLDGLDNLTEAYTMEFSNNLKLSNFCSLEELVLVEIGVSLNIFNNEYNPTKQDIIDGNCSL